jgi:hypothetical protein
MNQSENRETVLGNQHGLTLAQLRSPDLDPLDGRGVETRAESSELTLLARRRIGRPGSESLF